MLTEKIRVMVHTNTNIKMLISLPTHLTIQNVLPIIERKYAQVIQQNISHAHEEADQYQISHITLRDCFIPLSEEVSDVLNNNDEIHVVVDREDFKHGQPSKKQQLRDKKQEKEKKLQEKQKPQEHVPDQGHPRRGSVQQHREESKDDIVKKILHDRQLKEKKAEDKAKKQNQPIKEQKPVAPKAPDEKGMNAAEMAKKLLLKMDKQKKLTKDEIVHQIQNKSKEGEKHAPAKAKAVYPAQKVIIADESGSE